MLFNSLTFLIFFAFVYSLYLTTTHRKQNIILLCASYAFYSAWDWRFLSLILISTASDFILGQKISESGSAKQKKFFLICSLSINLGLLAFFKYFNFFIDSFAELSGMLGMQANLSTLNILLPVGISFYTFQTLSYSIDIYRGNLKPTKSILNFALFVAYFPQLVAGPIERAKTIIPQLESQRTLDKDKLAKGAWLILFGYFLKVFVADNLAPIVNSTFEQTGIIDGSLALTSVYAFAFQILGDFAGYSSIAIGVSMLMGIELMTNFRQPYFITSPQKFWQHWHISLSTWLRDYLYISLGGNRKGIKRTNVNLFTTMVLGGIWHGAAWNFIIWGVYQGSILIIHRLYVAKDRISRNKSRALKNLLIAVNVVFMFHVTCYGWLIFRAESFQQISDMTLSITNNFHGISTAALLNIQEIFFYTTLLILIQWQQFKHNDNYILLRQPIWLQSLVYSMLLICIIMFGAFESTEFIYFQF